MNIVLCFLFVTALVAVATSLPANNHPNYPRHYEPEEDDEDRRQFIYMPDAEGKLHYVDLKQEVDLDRRAASPSDVTFYLYTKENKIDPFVISAKNPVELDYFPFYKKQNINVFIIHGWLSSYTAEINTILTKAILDNYDVNVFIVDWNEPASAFYTTAKKSVPEVGAIVGNFISQLIDNYKLHPSHFGLIGHSLGAHVAGCAGAEVAKLKGKLDYIIGLDPAGPLFTVKKTDNRLDKSDAEFVHIIHTNGGLLGFGSALGHADYYPNGGKSQLGCGIDLAGGCSHSRSYQYLAESIRKPEFHSVLCNSYSNFEKGTCNSNPRSMLGGFLIDRSANGDYYLKTGKQFPFALGRI